MSWRLNHPSTLVYCNHLRDASIDEVTKAVNTFTDEAYVEGPYGFSIGDFNATSSKIDVGSDKLGVGDISISTTIKVDGWGENNLGTILHNGKTMLQIWSVQEKILFAREGTEGTTASSNSSIAVAGIYHILVTSTSAGVTNFFIDSVPSGTADQAAGTPEAGTTNTIIGNSDASDRTFDGGIGTTKIFNFIATRDEAIVEYRKSKRGM